MGRKASRNLCGQVVFRYCIYNTAPRNVEQRETASSTRLQYLFRKLGSVRMGLVPDLPLGQRNESDSPPGFFPVSQKQPKELGFVYLQLKWALHVIVWASL